MKEETGKRKRIRLRMKNANVIKEMEKEDETKMKKTNWKKKYEQKLKRSEVKLNVLTYKYMIQKRWYCLIMLDELNKRNNNNNNKRNHTVMNRKQRKDEKTSKNGREESSSWQTCNEKKRNGNKLRLENGFLGREEHKKSGNGTNTEKGKIEWLKGKRMEAGVSCDNPAIKEQVVVNESEKGKEI